MTNVLCCTLPEAQSAAGKGETDRNNRTEAWTSVALKEVSYLCLGEKKIFMLTGVAWTCQLYYRTFIFFLRARYGMKGERFTSALVP